MKHEDRIHLVHVVPEKGRAKSFCGAVLRKGIWFDTPERIWKNCGEVFGGHRMAYRKHLRSNRLEYYSCRGFPPPIQAAAYWNNICPNCAGSADYQLALLANVP